MKTAKATPKQKTAAEDPAEIEDRDNATIEFSRKDLKAVMNLTYRQFYSEDRPDLTPLIEILERCLDGARKKGAA